MPQLMHARSHMQLFEQHHHWTPVGEGRLEQVQADECGEQEPQRVYPVAQRDAEQHEESGDHPEIAIHGHESLLWFARKNRTGTVMRESSNDAISPAISAMAKP